MASKPPLRPCAAAQIPVRQCHTSFPQGNLLFCLPLLCYILIPWWHWYDRAWRRWVITASVASGWTSAHQQNFKICIWKSKNIFTVKGCNPCAIMQIKLSFWANQLVHLQAFRKLVTSPVLPREEERTFTGNLARDRTILDVLILLLLCNYHNNSVRQTSLQRSIVRHLSVTEAQQHNMRS